jgi:tRNA threonylcarbamoyladenosine biosynthesis protein TsaB
MKILAADTALGACSAAVLENGEVRAHALELMARGHAEALAPMVEEVMRKAGLIFTVLDRLGVTTGPGTFTGQRVGLAFMRGLALTLKKPLVGVTTLDAMAEAALSRTGASLAIACADARRSEIYLGARTRNGKTIIEPVLLALSDAVARVASLVPAAGETIALAGTAAEIFSPLLATRGIPSCDSLVREPDAVFVAKIAALASYPEHPPRPLYLRAPDAKLPNSP